MFSFLLKPEPIQDKFLVGEPDLLLFVRQTVVVVSGVNVGAATGTDDDDGLSTFEIGA